MALRAFSLRIILRPCAVRHKFRDDAIILGGIAKRNPLRNRIQAILNNYTAVGAPITGRPRESWA